MGDVCGIAIAGIGLVGRRHAESIGRQKNAQVCAVVDPNEDGHVYAKENGLPWFGSLTDMFKALSPDGVILSTPTPLHVEQGLECIENGCPTLVEKPIGTSSADAMKLIAGADTAGVPLLVGHHRRHNPLIHKAREIIDSGRIGQIRAVHSQCWFYKPDYYFDQTQWRKRKGAGPILVNLVHDVDLIRHLCGEVVSVQAQAAPSSRGFENEEVAGAVIRLDNGAIGTLTVSDGVIAPWSWEMTSSEYPAYPRTSESCYLIGGSRGALSLPDLTLWNQSGERDWWKPISATTVICGSSNPLDNQIANFVAVIAGEAEPLVSGIEALRSLRVIEAIQASAVTGQTTELDPISSSPVMDLAV